MIGTMLWKEYREGRGVWLTLALVGVCSIYAVPPVMELLEAGNANDQGPLTVQLASLWLTIYGLVVGSMMLAGERESKTLPFLDILSPRRASVWLTKVLAGALLTVSLGFFLTVLLHFSGLDLGIQPRWGILFLPLIALETLPWGLLGSALCRTVLPAVGLALVAYLGSWAIALILGQALPRWLAPPLVLLVLRLGMDGMALFLSVGLFSQHEEKAPLTAFLLPGTPQIEEGAPTGVRASLWLMWRQGRGAVYAVLILGALAGFGLSPFIFGAWPIVSLGLGVLCGLMTWSDEQGSGYARYLGDQRLPLGRLWLFKIAFWLGVATLGLVVMALSTALSFATARGLTGQGPESGPNFLPLQLGARLIHPLVFFCCSMLYGFGLAQLAVFIWRKTVITLVLALLGALGIFGLWVPTLVLGGAPAWQILALPVLWLIVGRLLIWAWTTVGVNTRRPLLVLTGCSALSTLWLTFWLYERVQEIPLESDPFQVETFQASLPNAEQNQARLRIRSSLDLMPRTWVERIRIRGRVALQEEPLETRLAIVADKGWQAAWPGLGEEMDELFKGEWYRICRQVVDLPLGVVEDPAIFDQFTAVDTPIRCRIMTKLVAVRALQLTARGEDEEGLNHLAVALALGRNLRHKAVLAIYLEGINAERFTLSCVEQMLPMLLSNPRRVRRLLDELTRHENESPTTLDPLQAEYLNLWLRLGRLDILDRRDPAELRPQHISWFSQLVGMSMQTPWERARAERQYQLSYSDARRVLDGVPVLPEHRVALQRSWFVFLASANWSAVRRVNQELLCLLRGLRLELALALYEKEHLRPAATLSVLVPAYVKSVPLDPFAIGQPMQYRVADEKLRIPLELPDPPQERWLEVDVGQGIVWSVGPNQRDETGTIQGRHLRTMGSRGQMTRGDWVFVVPRWPTLQR